MPGKHAQWSPSGAPFWYNDGHGCPARVMLPPKPETTSPAAEEGTRLHELAAQIAGEEGHGVMSAEDHAKLANYLEYVDTRAYDPMIDLHIEVATPLTPITGEKDAFGTIDALAISDTLLEVIDLKTGGKLVSPTSDQLKLYAAAVVYEIQYQGEKVMCTVHQHGEPKSVTYATEELLAWADQVRQYIAKAEQADELIYRPGETNCMWCPHAIDCPAQKEWRDQVAAKDFAVSDDPEELAADLNMVGALLQWCAEVQRRALASAEAGATIPGYKLVRARTIRRWVEGAEEKLVALLGDAAYDRKLIGLTQADKLVDAETMTTLTMKPEGKPTLAPEDDPRPAINDAAADFNDV